MSNKVDKQYKDTIKYVLKNGVDKSDRTGTGTISTFGREMRFNMKDGLPLLTTKEVFHKSVIYELLWMLGNIPKEYDEYGNTNIKYLVDNGINIWVGDAYKSYKEKMDGNKIEIMGYPTTKKEFIDRIKNDEHFAKVYGELGPIYGKQWTSWVSKEKVIKEMGGSLEISQPEKEINQIEMLIEGLRKNPDSRRLMVNAWNVGDLEYMTLPPCHYGFQCWTRELSREELNVLYNERRGLPNAGDTGYSKGTVFAKDPEIPRRAISLKITQRSCDLFLGVPFNIASYSILLHMISQCVNMVPEELIWSGGDVHIYKNHIEQCEIQSKRRAKKLPKLVLNPKIKEISEFKFEDITIKDYKHHPHIKGKLSN